MDKKVRRFWSGRLHPGDIVLHKGIRCQVASDFQFSKKILHVPAGHVPIFCCDVVNFGKQPVYTVPLDDIKVWSRT